MSDCVVCPARGRRIEQADQPPVCQPCRVWLADILAEIPTLYTELPDPFTPLTRGDTGPRVSGSRERPLPFNADLYDLQQAVRLQALDATGPDRIGHISAATQMYAWCRHIAQTRNLAETGPYSCRWLADRLDWICNHYEYVDGLAVCLRQLRGALAAYAPPADEQRPARPERRTAPCPGCDNTSLWWHPSEERVRCDSPACYRTFTDTEYATYAKQIARRARRSA